MTHNIPYTSTPNILDANAVLRLLGQVALRAADGQEIRKDWLIQAIEQADAVVRESAYPPAPYLTVSEAYSRMRIGRSTFYDLLHKRLLKTVMIGARRMVPLSEISRYMAENIDAGAPV